jgi:inhibitor of KinA sporulation pathway (predicted exonuclease)
LDFAAACRQLAAEHQAGARPWASWGEYDRRQFVRQCKATGVPYPFGSRHINVKQAFADAFELRKRPGMAEALRIAGLPLEGRHHRGADDAWNIAALVLALMRRDARPVVRGT